MTGHASWTIDDTGATSGCSIEPHQLSAAADPHRPTKELVQAETTGNFRDLESLLDQLGSAPIIELGKPLPFEKFLPKCRLGDCHASHNRALFGEED
jgi:hypothetical protein